MASFFFSFTLSARSFRLPLEQQQQQQQHTKAYTHIDWFYHKAVFFLFSFFFSTTMSSTFVKVHPMVLLNVVDHATRVHLSHPSDTFSGPFLNTAGVLMGTTSEATAAAGEDSCIVDSSSNASTNVVVATSFELPFKVNDNGEALADTAPAGDAAFITRVLREEVDWQAARQHREQLDAVMPESTVVGCYVVCRRTAVNGPNAEQDSADGSDEHAGEAAVAADASSCTLSKRPRSEKQARDDDALLNLLQPIAQGFAAQLRHAHLLPPNADGYVLLIVYDGDKVAVVEQAGSHLDDAAVAASAAAAPPLSPPPPAPARPTLSVSSGLHRLPFDTLWVPVTADAVGEESGAMPAPVAVTPADMEWIGLANEARVVGHKAVAPPNAARLAASSISTRRPPVSTLSTAASTQNCRAAEGLLSSLHVLRRVLDAPHTPSPALANTTVTTISITTTTTTPGELSLTKNDGPAVRVAELLRTVATCVRNVPQKSNDTHCSSSLPSADLVQAALALEAQCAVQLRELQAQQRAVVLSRVSAMSGMGQRSSPPLTSMLMAGKRDAMHGRRREKQEAGLDFDDFGGGEWRIGRDDRGMRVPCFTVLYGHVWPNGEESKTARP